MADIARTERTVMATPFLLKSYLVTGSATSEGEVPHDMGKKPIAYWVVNSDSAADVTNIVNISSVNTADFVVKSGADKDFYIFAIFDIQDAQDGGSIG